MAAPNPTLYSRAFDFAGFQRDNPTLPAPGLQISAELDTIGTALATTIRALADIRRSDGALNNTTVTWDGLATNLRGLIGGFNPRGNWTTATAYAARDWVFNVATGQLYIVPAGQGHTSGDFAADLEAGKWQIASSGITQSIADVSIAAALASHVAALNPHPQYLLAASNAPVPVGAEVDYAGILAPTGYLFCYGQAVSRSAYAALLAALSMTLTGTVASGSSTISSLSIDPRAMGLIGAVVEGVGVPAGATVITLTATTIALSANATANGSARALRILPYGAGDGALTFNVPDRRGRTVAGRDDMGGVAASRLTIGGSGLTGENLAATGGDERAPAHTHGVNDAGHYHTGTTSSDGAHQHDIYNTYLNVAGGNYAGGANQFSNTNTVTQVAGTHGHSFTTGSVVTGASIQTAGTGGSQNVQPTGIANKIICAGA